MREAVKSEADAYPAAAVGMCTVAPEQDPSNGATTVENCVEDGGVDKTGAEDRAAPPVDRARGDSKGHTVEHAKDREP